MNAVVTDAKRVFLKKGTCSQTLCFLLDREFGHLKPDEERAADPLAGGLLHDVGKLFISQDILEKKGSLDEGEFAAMSLMITSRGIVRPPAPVR